MLVYEFADGTWIDELTALEDRVSVDDAIVVAEISWAEWNGPWYATFARAALNAARRE